MIKLTVESLYGGGAVERFHGELEKAIANIVDPNTPAKKPRKVKLEMMRLGRITIEQKGTFDAITLNWREAPREAASA